MQILKLHDRDNVAVALQDLPAGCQLEHLVATQDIPRGHKIALVPIEAGEFVWKYGFPIGRASVAIGAGAHVHAQNLASALSGGLAPEGAHVTGEARKMNLNVPTTFRGYRRQTGRVGIRNEIWIVNTVSCVNVTAERIAQKAQARHVRDGSAIDGVYAFSHPYGCSQLGGDLGHTQSILRSLAKHPNAGGVLVLGLGCENNQMGAFLEGLEDADRGRLLFFNAQEVGDEVAEGLRRVEDLVERAQLDRREEVSVRELMLGMKCGGSDGFSGITANPLVGRVSDWLTQSGGTALLTEVPEMFGAEGALFSRAQDANVLRAATEMVENFKSYFLSHGEPIDENPSPGNREGGITTLEEKSLGCVQKGGESIIRQIVPYGGQAQSGLGGLALVNGPGSDGVSATALAAAGAQLILFTTGRGTPLGVQTPTLKISSNTDLFERKPGWIDFDAGPLLQGADPDEVTSNLIRLILDVASGEKTTRNEDYGFREISIWKQGVTL